MVPPLPFLGLAGRAELALADACGALELPQLLADAKLLFSIVSALGPNPALLMLLLSWRRQELWPRGWVAWVLALWYLVGWDISWE